MRKAAVLTAVLGAVLYWAPGAQAFECGTTLDTFTRANGTDLGPNWTEQAPDPAIFDGELIATGTGKGLATYNGIESDEACVDVTASPGSTTYAALVLRYASLTNNVFVKVQGFGNFMGVYFSKGNDGTPWNPGQQPHLVTAFSAARLHVAVNGTTVTAEIDTNFDNQPEHTITEQNLPLAGLGGGIGIGGFNLSRLDNFAIPTKEVPETARFRCRGEIATHLGSDAGDLIRGTKRRDVIVGLGARDIVRGRGGRDLICGGNGSDTLIGGKAKDKLFGETGRDFLRGGRGKDTLKGGVGRDRLIGGPKNDVCAGGAGKDVAKNC